MYCVDFRSPLTPLKKGGTRIFCPQFTGVGGSKTTVNCVFDLKLTRMTDVRPYLCISASQKKKGRTWKGDFQRIASG